MDHAHDILFGGALGALITLINLKVAGRSLDGRRLAEMLDFVTAWC